MEVSLHKGNIKAAYCRRLTRVRLYFAQQLPSEKDSPETLRAKMGTGNPNATNVPVPTLNSKFGKQRDETENNPFGFAEDDQDHYW